MEEGSKARESGLFTWVRVHVDPDVHVSVDVDVDIDVDVYAWLAELFVLLCIDGHSGHRHADLGL